MKTQKQSNIIYLVLAGIWIMVLSGCSEGSSVLPEGNKPQEVISELSREDLADLSSG